MMEYTQLPGRTGRENQSIHGRSIARPPLGLVLMLLAFALLAPAARAQVNHLPPVKTVFLIVMENLSWSAVQGSPDAPYINQLLLPQAAYCTQYYPPGPPHPSEPNYIWLEAGTNFGLIDDAEPFANHLASTNHLVSLLRRAGISWKTYQEDITGQDVPLYPYGAYVPRHNPFVYFDDVTGTNNSYYAYGIAHIRPYSELAQDLINDTVAAYNFITPNLCNDMHDYCSPFYNKILQGDAWLSTEIPRIMSSAAYQRGGAIFITWDEASIGQLAPMGMILVSPYGRGGGYASSQHLTHSSTLRTIQELFGVYPLMGDAANAPDLLDLFTGLRLAGEIAPGGNGFQLTITGATPGRTNLLQRSGDLQTWFTITNGIAPSSTYQFIDKLTKSAGGRFYRMVQFP